MWTSDAATLCQQEALTAAEQQAFSPAVPTRLMEAATTLDSVAAVQKFLLEDYDIVYVQRFFIGVGTDRPEIITGALFQRAGEAGMGGSAFWLYCMECKAERWVGCVRWRAVAWGGAP